MNIKKITDQLIAHEGLELKPYKCPAGKLTIGVGRKGITEQEAVMLLENDIQECIADLQKIFQDDQGNQDNQDKENRFDKLPEPAQRVLVDMRFNLGFKGFRKFKKMIKAVRQQDFTTAAKEMKDSLWYTQVGKRAETLAEMMQISADPAS
ncbi:MAG: glycoside hydrolase family protein [Thermodesulfobacteriota bacterium]|nr:glycoside hydrolase family protein [Thermodesulfobacteriota bacterium]